MEKRDFLRIVQNEDDRFVKTVESEDFVIYQEIDQYGEELESNFYAVRFDDDDNPIEKVRLMGVLEYEVIDNLNVTNDDLEKLFDADYAGEFSDIGGVVQFMWFKKEDTLMFE